MLFVSWGLVLLAVAELFELVLDHPHLSWFNWKWNVAPFL